MKKTLIALAAFAAVSAFAQSSVTMYGTVDIGFGANTTNGAETKFQQVTSYNSNSKIGFKGTEDLGGGLKANFALESANLNMEDGSTPVSFGRASWVGLEGAFGDIKMGRIASKAATVMGQFDLNGTSGSSALATAGLSAVTWNATSRRNSQVQYTKALGEVTVHVANSLDTDSAVVADVNNKNRTTLGVTYASGPFAVGAVTESAANDTAGARSAYAVGASYDMKTIKVALTYNQRETEAAGQGLTASAVVPMGAANVGIQFASNNGSALSATAVKSATELFANYALSKRTSIYIDSVFGADSAAGANKAYNLGVIHNF